MMKMLSRGGILVLPILGCSILALAIFLERLVRTSGRNLQQSQTADQILAAFRSGTISVAQTIAAQSNSPEGRLLSQAMEVHGQVVWIQVSDYSLRSQSLAGKGGEGSGHCLCLRGRPDIPCNHKVEA
jgi:biopolymer transport protein ExbB/TolQ